MGQSTIPTHARSRGGHVVRTLPGKFTYSIPGKVGLGSPPLENKIKLNVGTPPPPPLLGKKILDPRMLHVYIKKRTL